VSQETTTPFSSQVNVFVELSLEGLNQVIEFSLILLSDTSQSDNTGSLLANQFSESCLTSDEAERNFLLSAELRKPDNSFNGVNIVGNDDESSFFILNKTGDVVQAVLDSNRGLGISSGLVFSLELSSFQSSFSLLLLGFRLVLSEELQQSGSLISVNSVGELVECGRNLESLEEDSLLSLEKDVFGPTNKSGEVSGGLDITSDSEASGLFLEEGVSLCLGGLGGLSGLLEVLSWRHFVYAALIIYIRFKH